MYILKIFKDILYVSKLTKTANKKLKIFYSVGLANLTVFFDLIVILTIARIFEDDNPVSKNFVVQFFLENQYLLPLIVLFRFTTRYLDVINITKLKYSIEENLRVYLMQEVFDKGNYSTSDAYYFTNSLSSGISNFYSATATLVNIFIQMLVYVTYLLYQDVQTVLTFLVGGILLILPSYYLTKQGRKFADRSFHAGGHYFASIQKIIDNMYLIKILKTVDTEILNFRSMLKNFYSIDLSNQKVGVINSSLPSFATYFILASLIAFSSVVKNLTLDFIGILVRLFQELSNFNKMAMIVSNAHVILEKFYAIAVNESNKYDENFRVNESNQTSAIKFKEVKFRYFGMEEFIFEDISFSIPKNQHTIITGPNGSGKSTLLGLAAGVIFAESGTIESFSNSFGYVGVTPMIIDGSIRENLTYGSSIKHDDQKLMAIVKDFKIFNEESSYSLDKAISNTTLSSGQMQKISFIRALLADVDILLLDESTSNLDTETKKKIFNILKNKSITIINATHSIDEFSYFDNHLKVTIENNKRFISIENKT
jgi:ATP-binding cassette, subfamily B, bacterial